MAEQIGSLSADRSSSESESSYESMLRDTIEKKLYHQQEFLTLVEFDALVDHELCRILTPETTPEFKPFLVELVSSGKKKLKMVFKLSESQRSIKGESCLDKASTSSKSTRSIYDRLHISRLG